MASLAIEAHIYPRIHGRITQGGIVLYPHDGGLAIQIVGASSELLLRIDRAILLTAALSNSSRKLP